jgi:hypothetical protein
MTYISNIYKHRGHLNSRLAKDIQAKKPNLSKALNLFMFTIVCMLVLCIAPLHGTWAFEQKNNQLIAEVNNFIGYDQVGKTNDNETSLTKRSQDVIVNKIIAFFNEPRNINSSISFQSCTTHDFRCCILNSKPCIPIATITSVIDAKGVPIPLRGVSSSKEITFIFTSFVKVGAIAFECSLDHSAFKPCTSPFTVNSLIYAPVNNVSRHDFEVRMSGMDLEDSPKARFIWFSVQR